MTEPTPSTPPAPPARRSPLRFAVYGIVTVGAGAALWFAVGKNLLIEYQKLQSESIASEDSVPVGYVGLNYRRSYNDRPLHFHDVVDGRKTLFAAKGEDGKVDTYDVTDAAFDTQCLQGGFGRDSIPGIDYPIIDTPESSKGRTLRGRQAVIGFSLKDGPRAYPEDLLTKIELVNDVDGSMPILVVYDRKTQSAIAFDRTIDHSAITFGTTGYSCENRPLLYDRKTKSLWLLGDDGLKCVNGPLKGQQAAPYLKAKPLPWSDWKAKEPKTTIVMGNDRKKPIPTE